MTSSTRFLLWCLGIGFLVRAGLVAWCAWDTAILTQADQSEYLALAAGIAQHWDFGAWFGAERMPLYPLFLAVCHLLTGLPLDPVGLPERSLVAALIVQNVLGLAAVYVMYRVGTLYSRTTACLCAAFAALNLNMILYSSQMLTEALFTPLMALVLYVFLLYRRTGGAVRLGALAALLGLGTLVRSVTMYFPVFIVPYLLLEWGRGGLGPRLKRVVLFCALFAVFLLPWMGRNLYLFGHASPTCQGEAHIVGWVIPGIAQYEEGVSYAEARAHWAETWRERLGEAPEDVRESPLARASLAQDFLREYVAGVSPLSVAKAWFWGAVKNVFTPVTVELGYVFEMDYTHFSDTPGASFPEQAWNFLAHNENKLYVGLMLAGMAVMCVLRLAQAAGLVRLAARRPWDLAACLLLAAYFLAVNGPVGYAKYRLPLEPVFILLTAQAARLLPAFLDGVPAEEEE